MLDILFGEGQSGLKILFFVIVVLALLALAFWLLRRFRGGRLGAGAASRGKELSARSGWMLVSGIIDLILAAITVGAPGGAFAFLVGIDMLFGGAALIAMGTTALWPTRSEAAAR